MRVLTPELESALDKLKAADDYFLEHKAVEEIRQLWPSKGMPQVVTDHRVPPGVTYLTHISGRVRLHDVDFLQGVEWMRRPIPAGGVPLEVFAPVDLTLADPEE